MHTPQWKHEIAEVMLINSIDSIQQVRNNNGKVPTVRFKRRKEQRAH